MRILVTASELIEHGLWDDFCEKRGYNVWAVNEGLMDSDEEFSFSRAEAMDLGLTPRSDAYRDYDYEPLAETLETVEEEPDLVAYLTKIGADAEVIALAATVTARRQKRDQG